MRRGALVLALVAGCARATPAPPAAKTIAVAPVDAHPPPEPVVAVLEPPLGGECVLRAQSATLEGLVLCGAAGDACFGHVANDVGTRLESVVLPEGEPAAATLHLANGGAHVVGVTEAAKLAFHPRGAIVVGGFIVPVRTKGVLHHVSGYGATIDFAFEKIEGAAARTSTRLPCAELALDPPLVDVDAAAKAAGLGKSLGTVSVFGEPRLPIYPTAGATAPSGFALYPGESADVYERATKRSRVVLAVPDGFVTGWIDDAHVGPDPNTKYARAPRLVMGARPPPRSIVCPHRTRVDLRFDGRIVRAAWVDENAPFDPEQPEEVFARAQVKLVRGAVAVVDRASLADCAAAPDAGAP